MKKIYVLGNPLLERDSFAFKVKNIIKEKYKIEEIDPLELINKDEDMILIDVSPDVNDVVLYTDVNMFEIPKPFSLHDADVAFILKLKNKLIGQRKMYFVVLPEKGDIKKVALKVEKILDALISTKQD